MYVYMVDDNYGIINMQTTRIWPLSKVYKIKHNQQYSDTSRNG